jgi:hypothetical protein
MVTHRYFVTIMAIVLIEVVFSGCATKTKPYTFATSEHKEVLTNSEYEFIVGEPTPGEPVITFRLIKTDYYRTETKYLTKETQTTEPNDLIKLTILPLQIAGAIVTFGNLDVIDTISQEKTRVKGSHWQQDNNTEKIKRQISCPGKDIHLAYEYCGENKVQIIRTDVNGEIKKDLRKMARSVALDAQAQEYVEFIVTVPSLANTHKGIVKISQKLLIEIYEKCSAEDNCES